MGFGAGSGFKDSKTARYVHKVTEITTTSYAIGEAENGHILAINAPAGELVTVTLPADTLPVGWNIKIMLLTSMSGVPSSSTWKIASADDDLMFGAYQAVSIAAAQEADVFAANGSSNAHLVFDSGAKGTYAGSWLEFFLMGENEWVVRGEVYVAGTPASAWSDT